ALRRDDRALDDGAERDLLARRHAWSRAVDGVVGLAEAQMLRPDEPWRDQRRPPHDVAQLAHVAGPVTREHGVERLTGERARRRAELEGRFHEEAVGERFDVLPPLAQGRDDDRELVEAVVEVLPEAPGLDLALER